MGVEKIRFETDVFQKAHLDRGIQWTVFSLAKVC